MLCFMPNDLVKINYIILYHIILLISFTNIYDIYVGKCSVYVYIYMVYILADQYNVYMYYFIHLLTCILYTLTNVYFIYILTDLHTVYMW